MAAQPALSLLEPLVDDAATRKARGAFFTPDALTAYMCRWALRSPADRVLEPSCGEAAFLLAAAQRLDELKALRPAPRPRSHPPPSPPSLANRLVGVLHGCLTQHTAYDETTAWPRTPAEITTAT